MYSVLPSAASSNRPRNAWKCWKCLDSRPKRKSMADPVLDTSAVSMKMPIARSDRLTAPKEIGASVDQGFLRRLPSFATILGSSKGLHASGRSRHEQPTVDSDLCPDLEIPVSKETVQRETVTHVASSEESECNRSRLSETLGDLVLSAQMDNNRGANRSIGTPTEPTDAPKLTEVSKSPQEKRSKAHNFHSQRSNQSDSPIFSAEHHDCATDNIPINKETEVSTIHLTVKGPAPCPVSCSTCGQQTVKEGWKNLEWYQLPVADKLPLLNEHSPRCQSRQLSSDAEVLVIPETPNAVNAIPSYRDVRYGDPEPMKYMSRASTPNFMVGLTSTGHSSPRPLLSESDSTKHGALSTSASTKCTNSPPSLSDGNFQKTSPDYEESSKYLPEKGASRSTEPDDAAETPLDRCEFDKTSMNNGIPEELSGVAASPSGAVLSEALLSRGSIHETDGGVPVVGSLPIGRDGAWSIATDVDVEGELALKSVVEELRLTKPPPAEPCNSAQLPCEGKVSSALVVRTASDLPHRRKFTNRERARMALVAARGKRLTTAEIVDWNMQMFSHLREKRGTLERNIGAALSVFPEFDGKKVAKTHGRKQLWGFSNASWRDRYEREYAEYCMPSDNLTSRHRETPLRSMTVTDKVSTYTTPTLAEPGPTHKDAIAAGLKDCEVSLLKSPSIYKSPQTPSLGDLSKGRLFEEPPMRRISPEETMTQAEIDQKVLEIKQRPSRKRFFGSDHRLAHVRRYGRQDIHDERGAAEEPRLHKKFKRTTTAFASTGGTPEYGKEVTAIRELFSLPENAIPMNAGQAELAFRDGTLVRILSLES